MKKALAFILAVALLCIMAVGTTLTYFTDTDFDKNTMTVGNVGITQYEKDRYGAQIDDDALKLYPATAGVATDGLVPAANNGVDKFVTVKLDDNSENAYVRTVFAFEMMKVDGGWKSPIADKVILVDNGIQMTNIEIEKNGVHYYPILVNHEKASWDEAIAVAFGKLQEGRYAEYGAEKKQEFLRNLGG